MRTRLWLGAPLAAIARWAVEAANLRVRIADHYVVGVTATAGTASATSKLELIVK